MELPEWMTPDQVAIEPYQGAGAGGGPVYGPLVSTRARVEVGTQVVRDASGARVIAVAAVFVPLDVGPVPPLSRVTLPDGSRREVVTSNRHEWPGDSPLPEHCEVSVR